MRGYQSHYRPSTNQKVTASGTSAAITNAFGAQIQVVRVVSTQPIYVALGVAPVATANNLLLPANLPEYFTVNPGEKVAVLQAATGGEVHVTEMTQ